MLNKMHFFLHFFFVVFAPNRPTFGFRSGPGDRQKTGFLGFRENTVFDRFRWSATLTTKNRSFWGTPFWRGISTMATIHQYTRDEYMGSGQRCSKRGSKMTSKMTQKGSFLATQKGPKMSSFWRSFWASIYPLLTPKGVQKEGPKWHQKGSKKWPKMCHFWPFLGHFLDPLFSGTCWICLGFGIKCYGTCSGGVQKGHQKWPKKCQKVTKHHFCVKKW